MKRMHLKYYIEELYKLKDKCNDFRRSKINKQILDRVYDNDG